MKIPPKWSNCPRTPRRPTAVRFNYPWWRGSKAQQAGMVSVREVIRRADVFSPIVEEPFCFISASKFQVRREHWQTHREGSIPFLSVLPDRMRISKRTFHLGQTSARHPDCCYQAYSVCVSFHGPTGALKALFLHKLFKCTIWLNSF